MADAFQNLLAGYGAGTELRRQREADQRAQKFNALAGQAYGASGAERDQLIGQAVSVDAQSGMALDKGMRGVDESRNETLVNSSRLLLKAPEQYRDSVYQRIRPVLVERYGMQLPPTYDQTVGQAAQSIVDAYSPKSSELAPRVVGDSLVDSTGKVLYQAPPQQEYQWSDRAGAWIPKPTAAGTPKAFEDGSQVPAPEMRGADGAPISIDPNMSPQDIASVRALEGGPVPAGFTAQQSGGLQAIPVAGIGPKPDISPAEERRLQLAEEAAQRAREAADRSRFGNAPAGFRFKDDGTLEAIPGGPKPAGSAATEGERKAATLLQRLNFSLAQMQDAIKDSPSAASPNMASEVLRRLPLVGEPAANAATPEERQRVESAQLDILDAALTLGTGAAYTREQLEGYRRAYFPQIGDSDAAIRDKAARLQNIIEAAKIAAGRAAPKAEAPSSSRRLRFNPSTGKLE